MRPRTGPRVHPHRRVPALLTICHGEGQFSRYEGEVVDLSASGMCIILPEATVGPLVNGAAVQVSVEKRGGQSTLELSANLVASASGQDRQFRIHLQFDQPRLDVLANVSMYRRILARLQTPSMQRPG